MDQEGGIIILMKEERHTGDQDGLIYVYTAEQAVEDGVLTEVDPELAKEAGYQWPVRITQGVKSLVTPTEEERMQGQSLEGRLWDMLWLARIAILDAHPEDRFVTFDVMFGRRSTRLWGCVDATSELAIHIITPGEY